LIMAESIKVFAPATVANVGCGFDILGFAVDHPGDEVVLCKSNKSGLEITRIKGDNGRLSLNPKSNTVGVAIQKYMDQIGSNQGIEISLHKKMPFESGLGSSAASAVAGVFAVNVIKLTSDNRKIGYNSDYYGFRSSLQNWLPRNGPIKALVLGNGGASKAVIAVLKDINLSYQIVSRKKGVGVVDYGQTKDLKIA